MITVVVPVFGNLDTLQELVERLRSLNTALKGELEAVFVVDGSPDRSLARLSELLPGCGFRAQLLSLSRNFGSFAAIRAGLAAGRGEYFAVMAADLQEPAELLQRFYDELAAQRADVVVGTRQGRHDPGAGKICSAVFWWLYRRLVQKEVPAGGVDIFGCSREVRDRLCALDERNSSLVGLLFWLGYRRVEVPYERLPRKSGKSGWSFGRRVRYLLDSVFSFSDLPIKLLFWTGVGGLLLSLGLAFVVALARITGFVTVPGYSATVIALCFFGGLNCFGLGVIGGYVWRTFENTKGRPNYVVAFSREFN